MCMLSSMYQFMCMCAASFAYMCMYICTTVPDVPLPLQPTLGPPTSSRRPTWGKGVSTAVSAVQMSVKSDKGKDAGKHTKPLR